MWDKHTAPVFLISPPAHIVPAAFPRSFYYWMETVAEDGPVAEDVESTEKLRSDSSTATAFLIGFHKSQSKCSAAAEPGLQHGAVPRPTSPEI